MDSTMTPPPSVAIDDLVVQYEAILLDAYGVLVDGVGELPGARRLLACIESAGRPFLILTNDASRQPETIAARFRAFGLSIESDRIVTSGSLVAPYFAAHGLEGARCIVLGPEDSEEYVRAANAVPVSVETDAEIDALVIASGDGYPFQYALERALSAVARQIRRGREIALILPNPDLIYPKRGEQYGFTAGAAALLIEAGLARLFPGRDLQFVSLGKPNPLMFERARELMGLTRVVMVGDQLQTDIAGAAAAGLDSALIDTGVSHWRDESSSVRPDFLLRAPG